MSIDKEDRRFNVAKYQKIKPIISDTETEQIAKQPQSFHDHLLYFKCDVDQARTVIQTENRDTMISISESSVDTVTSALSGGDFGFFLQQLPVDNNYERNALSILLTRNDAVGDCPISREELRAIFQYVVDGMPVRPNKFTSLVPVTAASGAKLLKLMSMTKASKAAVAMNAFSSRPSGVTPSRLTKKIPA